METKTPKSLLLIFLGMAITLGILVIPLWIGNEQPAKVKISVIESADSKTSNPPVVEIQKPKEPSKMEKVSSEVFVDENQKLEDNKEDSNENLEPVAKTNPKKEMEIIAQQVDNVERLTDNIQQRTEAFFNEDRNLTSDLSLEEKAAIADTIHAFSNRTIDRIEQFLNRK